MDEEYEMIVGSGVVELLNKSEIDQQIATAHRYPRSVKKFRDSALMLATLNERVAGECIYALPRGNKTVEGASARFAEIIVSAWGNSRAGARIVKEDEKFVTAQGVFHDLEQNVAITYEVQRRITDKYNKRFSDDMIAVTSNAACSVALRNVVLKGVPKAIWADIYDAARQVVMGDFKTLANRRSEAVSKFQTIGISPAQICAVVGVVGIEDISLEHLVTLRGIWTAIKDGDTTPEQAFGDVSAAKKPAMSIPEMPQEFFDKNAEKWMSQIQSGAKTSAEIISLQSTKFVLTTAQKDEIKAWGEGK